MSIGGPKDAELAKLFDPEYAHMFYKDPEKHLAEVAGIIERNGTCQKCGKKSLQVLSVQEKDAVCKNCGHKQT